MSDPTPAPIKASWHSQSVPVPTWVAALAFLAIGPGDTLAAQMTSHPDVAELASSLEELTAKVDGLSAKVAELGATDLDVAQVLAEVVRALDARVEE